MVPDAATEQKLRAIVPRIYYRSLAIVWMTAAIVAVLMLTGHTGVVPPIDEIRLAMESSGLPFLLMLKGDAYVTAVVILGFIADRALKYSELHEVVGKLGVPAKQRSGRTLMKLRAGSMGRVEGILSVALFFLCGVTLLGFLWLGLLPTSGQPALLSATSWLMVILTAAWTFLFGYRTWLWVSQMLKAPKKRA